MNKAKGGFGLSFAKSHLGFYKRWAKDAKFGAGFKQPQRLNLGVWFETVPSFGFPNPNPAVAKAVLAKRPMRWSDSIGSILKKQTDR